jgi:hypothetical protein
MVVTPAAIPTIKDKNLGSRIEAYTSYMVITPAAIPTIKDKNRGYLRRFPEIHPPPRRKLLLRVGARLRSKNLAYIANT